MSLDPQARRVRGLIVGHPKAGKTGCLSCLVNAGYRLAVLDFDDNPDPYYQFVKKEFWDNISRVVLKDELILRKDAKFMEVMGEPKAFRKAFEALDHWVGQTGEDWGKVADWDTNTILLMDSLTSMGEAAFARILFVNNRNRGSIRDADWGSAMKDEDGLFAKLVTPRYKCHILATAHLKMVGPKIERSDKEDSSEIKAAKEAISAANVEIIPTRWYPSALGRQLPPEIARHFPTMVKADVVGEKRVIRTKPTEDLTLGVPADVPGFLPLETGMLTIFNKITGETRKEKE